MPRLQVPIIVSRFIISYNECEFKHMIVQYIKYLFFKIKIAYFGKSFTRSSYIYNAFVNSVF